MQISAAAIATSTPPPPPPSTGAAPAQAFHAVLHQTAKLTDKPAPPAKEAKSRDPHTPSKSHAEIKPASPASQTAQTAQTPNPTEPQTPPAAHPTPFPELLPTAPTTLPSEALPTALSAQSQSGDGPDLLEVAALKASTAPSLPAAAAQPAAPQSALSAAPNPTPESASPNLQPPAPQPPQAPQILQTPSTAPASPASDPAAPTEPTQKPAKTVDPSTSGAPAHEPSPETNGAAPAPDLNNALAPTTPPPPTVLPSAATLPAPSTEPAPVLLSATKPAATSATIANRANLSPAGPKRDPKFQPTAKPDAEGSNASDTDDSNPNALNPQRDLTAAVHEIAAPQTHNNSTSPDSTSPDPSAQTSLNLPNPPETLHTSPDPSTPAAAPNPHLALSDTPTTPAINTAKLIQTMSGSEMRVGMRTVDFGNISIRTSLAREGLSAQISLDHSGLGQALSAHLPAIEAKLSEGYGVKANVELIGGNSSSFSGNPEHNSQSRHPEQQTYSTLPSISTGALSQNSVPTILPAALPTSSRLDIRI